MMKKAFTLIEVNLAMMAMAVGAISIVGLYAFGYRESAQSREDVEATAVVDELVSPLVMAISHTNQKWSVFREEFSYPDEDGWGAYMNSDGSIVGEPDDKAKTAFTEIMSQLRVSNLKPTVESKFPLPGRSDNDGAARTLHVGLVIQHAKDSPIVRIGVRATPQPSALLSMPLFYTEARFQGDPEQ